MAAPDWPRVHADDDSFTLPLPPGLVLTPLAGLPPGQSYLYVSTPGDTGTFSLLRGPVATVGPAATLSQERAQGAEVTVLEDAPLTHHGQRAHRLRFRSVTRRGSELVEDPATGARAHRPAGTQTTEAEFLFWTGRHDALRVGYRIDPADIEARRLLQAMLAGFRVLRPPP